MTVVATEPASLVAVEEQCASVERWAEACTSVAELREACNKLSAIDSYLAHTSRDGRARVAAAMRRLEVRIGILLGPPERGGDRGNQHTGGKSSASEMPLTPNERSQFRNMADHEDIVEDEIAKSTDEQPASRRKVMDAIRPTRRNPLPEQARSAGWELQKAAERVQKIVRDDRFRSNHEQVAARLRDHLLYTIEACTDMLDLFDQLMEES